MGIITTIFNAQKRFLKIHHIMFKRMGGGMGSKTALFLRDGFPNVNHEHEITRVIKISKSFLGRTKSTCSKT